MSKKIIGYTVMTPMPRTDFDEEDPSKASYLKNKPEHLKERLATLEQNVAELMYKPLSISSFTNSISVAEIGSTVTDINLSWSFNKKPVSVTLDGAVQVAETSGSLALTGLSLTTDKTWTLIGTDEKNAVATKEAKLQFLNGIYYGVSTSIPENLSALTKVLTNNKEMTFTVTAGEGEYIWYFCPSRLGECNFNVGGFDGGFESLAVQLTNESGYTEAYKIYRSVNANLGTTTVTVSGEQTEDNEGNYSEIEAMIDDINGEVI